MQKYHMNRKEREINDRKEINEILKKGKFCTIAMCRDNEPYIVTLNYGFDEANNCLFFHAALKGLKIDFISFNPAVCATIIIDRGYIMNECAHAFRSVVIQGNMHVVENLEEKKHGMNVMLNHLENSPDIIKEKSLKNDKVYNTVTILRLEIVNFSGKKGR